MSLRHAHFIAIGGAGMGSLAGLLKMRGVRVTGSDRQIYPPMSEALRRWDVPVTLGFRAENVLAERPDLVVIGNAVRADNPEAKAAFEACLQILSFPDALYELAIRRRHSVVVAGTHGKTTTASLMATLLHETQRDPSFLIGGIALNFEASFREGGGPHFVVEGDEYDTAFFDKTPKFLHYHPQTLVISSVEFDHADIYRDLEHVKSAFRKLVAQMPADGTILAALARSNVRAVLGEAPCRVSSYGLGEVGSLDWYASELASRPQGTRFCLTHRGQSLGPVELPLHGEHNVENAVGAVATMEALGVPPAEAIAALSRFHGVKRRQELRGESRGVTVIDDFAHHPTAVKGTIAAMRARYPARRIVAVFEPRTNTSRRKIFQADYVDAFEEADCVVVSIVPDEPIYSATGPVTERLSASELAADLQARGVEAAALEGVGAIVDHLDRSCEAGDVVVVMSNGSFGNIWEKLLDRLRG
jgi:UDP-N-acetylmuramate: L-alanyl-gamma-D-glutamyl-meso-diaminopimelate ligase